MSTANLPSGFGGEDSALWLCTVYKCNADSQRGLQLRRINDSQAGKDRSCTSRACVFFFFVEENTSEGNEQIIAHICPELGWLVVLILTWKFHYANEASLTRS